MTRDELIAALSAANPKGRRDKIAIYADSYLDYQEAAANIREHGNLVAHPRTGAPLENPYIKIKSHAIAILNKIGNGLKLGGLWE